MEPECQRRCLLALREFHIRGGMGSSRISPRLWGLTVWLLAQHRDRPITPTLRPAGAAPEGGEWTPLPRRRGLAAPRAPQVGGDQPAHGTSSKSRSESRAAASQPRLLRQQDFPGQHISSTGIIRSYVTKYIWATPGDPLGPQPQHGRTGGSR